MSHLLKKEVDLNQLKNKIPDSILAQLPDVINKFGINSPLRLSHFLAQCACESGNFTIFSENLNYSAERLNQIFPSHFIGTDITKYQHNPVAIGNRIYCNRLGNGLEASGDGYNYRGRGCIQLTGKANYDAFGKAIGVDLIKDPDLVATIYSITSAGWFWYTNKLNITADMGSEPKVVATVTRRVNGAELGLDVRCQYFTIYYNLLK